MNKVLIGIDFSINSPAISVYDETNYYFISFTNNKNINEYKKIPNSLQIHNDLIINKVADIQFFQRQNNNENYIIDQQNKIKDANYLASFILNYVLTNFKTDIKNYYFALEGFSYMSSSRSFIDLILFNSVLRNMIYELFVLKNNGNNLIIFSPSDIKKFFTGKGNANKNLMLDNFIDNFIKDSIINNTNLYKYIISNKTIILDSKDNIKKPIDDIIDSYAILQRLKKYLII